MLGGYNIKPLIDLLDDAEVGAVAADAPEEDAADVRRLPRRASDRPTPGNANAKGVHPVLGRRRVVHQPPRSAGSADRHRVQGHRRDQHRRPVAGARRLEPPGHPAARAGHAEERPPRHRRRTKTASAARSSSSRRWSRKGHLVAYVGDVVGTGSSRKSRHQLGAVVHRRGHPLRPEQALRRRLPRRQDRADLLQHHGGRRRAADRARRLARWRWATSSSCAPTRARPLEERRGHRRVQAQARRAVRRGARRRPHSADHRPRPHRQARARRWACRPPRCSACPPSRPSSGKGFTLAQKMVGRACGLPEGQGVRPGTYCEPKMTTVGSPGHHRPDDARRAEGPGLPRLLAPTWSCSPSATPRPTRSRST